MTCKYPINPITNPNPVFSHVTVLSRMEVLTAEAMKSSAFWDIAPCSPLKVNVHFRSSVCYLFPHCFLGWLHVRPRIWRRYVPPKRRLAFNGLYDLVSQKTEPYIIHYCFNLTNFLLMNYSDKICYSHNEELIIISRKNCIYEIDFYVRFLQFSHQS
jgi:hypothetical protein